jgi:Tfp pilus assembly protein PilX
MNRPANQRGSALILAILVMFSMVALGVLAMRSTGQNLRSAGNLRMTKQVRQIAEAGLYHAITVMNREGPSIMPLRDDPSL